MLDLVHEHELKSDDVREISVQIGATQKLMLRNSNPRTGLEAKFSMEFAMAAALVAGRVGLTELTDGFVTRSDVNSVFAKVRCTTSDEAMPGDPAFAPFDRVSVVLASGERLEHAPVAHAKGSWQRPLTQAELKSKFADCASRVFDQTRLEGLFDQLWRLQEIGSIRDLRITRD
jgi:2-methylcitrate dehydratase PrpD